MKLNYWIMIMLMSLFVITVYSCSAHAGTTDCYTNSDGSMSCYSYGNGQTYTQDVYRNSDGSYSVYGY